MRTDNTDRNLWCLASVLGAVVVLALRCPAQAGELDTTFGDGGKVTSTSFGSSDEYVLAVAQQADGKIVAVGSVMVRYDSTGRLDPSFGTGGIVGLHQGYGRAVAIDANGKIIIASDYALARYNSDGSLDTSFGTGGMVAKDFEHYDIASAVAIQDDGKIVITGYTVGLAPHDDFALVRYNSNGTLDTGFGTAGAVTTDFDARLGSDDRARAVAIQSDRKLVVAGSANGFFALARYNSNGSLDTSFGTGGKIITRIGAGFYGWGCTCVAIQPDSRIVAAGLARPTGDGTDFTLARYNADGTLDTDFGTGGIVTTHFSDSSATLLEGSAQAVAIQGDGRIVVAGFVDHISLVYPPQPPNADFTLTRYNTDGSLDLAFGTGGKVHTDFSGASVDYCYAMVLQAGKIVLAGYSHTAASGWDYALARYETVTTVIELLDWLVVYVQQLAANAVITQGVGKSLLGKLEAAIQRADRGNRVAAINQLNALLFEVNALVQANVLTSREALPLYDLARSVIADLSP